MLAGDEGDNRKEVPPSMSAFCQSRVSSCTLCSRVLLSRGLLYSMFDQHAKTCVY